MKCNSRNTKENEYITGNKLCKCYAQYTKKNTKKLCKCHTKYEINSTNVTLNTYFSKSTAADLYKVKNEQKNVS